MHAESVAGADETAGDMERPLQYAGGSDRATDRSRARDRADTDGVSNDASTTGGANSSDNLDLDGDLPITGWESERELLTATLLGGAENKTQSEADGFSFTYPDYSADHLGVDSAYLAADMMNILENDSRVEDCTTMNQPQKNKKNTQSGGFNMSM